jgi:hypothetical protein
MPSGSERIGLPHPPNHVTQIDTAGEAGHEPISPLSAGSTCESQTGDPPTVTLPPGSQATKSLFVACGDLVNLATERHQRATSRRHGCP